MLKGGVLLAAFDARRPTRDIDFLAQDISNDANVVLALVKEIAAIELDDGLVFHHTAATAAVIRDDDEYSGVRVSLTCSLATAQPILHVDVNVGDPVIPAPEDVLVPRLLGGDGILLRGYPIPMVLAEKIITAVSRGTANTRWRDFGDIHALSQQHQINGDELVRALDGVAAHRAVSVEPLRRALEGYAVLAQSRYVAWRRKNLRNELPVDFGLLLDSVISFADPALTHSVEGLTWRPAVKGADAAYAWR